MTSAQRKYTPRKIKITRFKMGRKPALFRVSSCPIDRAIGESKTPCAGCQYMHGFEDWYHVKCAHGAKEEV